MNHFEFKGYLLNEEALKLLDSLIREPRFESIESHMGEFQFKGFGKNRKIYALWVIKATERP